VSVRSEVRTPNALDEIEAEGLKKVRQVIDRAEVV